MYFIFAVGRGPGSLCTLYTVHGAKGGARAQFRQKYALFYALLAHFLLKTNVTFVQGWASVLFKRTFRSLRSFPFF